MLEYAGHPITTDHFYTALIPLLASVLLLLLLLLQMLEDAGHPIATDHFYTAGYDSPFRLLNR
jgi:hypothetical protein